ncbi:MAG: hypothetical protein ACI977_000651 [Candidatus Nanohaloarchaea archaeon]|jgi:hypothetical protein
MEDMFEQLMSAETAEEALEAEKFFLDKAKEAVDTDFKATALDTAASFDEFRRLARDEYSQLFYAGFFAIISSCRRRPRRTTTFGYSCFYSRSYCIIAGCL